MCANYMPMPHDFWIHLNAEYSATWEPIFGTSRLPVRSPVPKRAVLRGLGERTVYMLALDQLSSEQLRALAERMSALSGVPADEVLEDIRRDGFPIREEVTSSASIHHPQRWIDFDEEDDLDY